MPNSVVFEVPPSPRHTSHIFVLGLCVFSSVPTFLNIDRAPGSLNAALPRDWVLLWATVLTFGSVVSLVGAFWRHKLTGLWIEQMGMVMVSVATIYYSVILIQAAGWDSLQNTSVVLGFGVACAVRWWQIQRYFKQVEEAKTKQLVAPPEAPDGGGKDGHG